MCFEKRKFSKFWNRIHQDRKREEINRKGRGRWRAAMRCPSFNFNNSHAQITPLTSEKALEQNRGGAADLLYPILHFRSLSAIFFQKNYLLENNFIFYSLQLINSRLGLATCYSRIHTYILTYIPIFSYIF